MDEWVRRRFELPSDTVGLEAKNSCGNVVDVCTPACNDRVAVDLRRKSKRPRKQIHEKKHTEGEKCYLSARNPSTRQGSLEARPCFGVGNLLEIEKERERDQIDCGMGSR